MPLLETVGSGSAKGFGLTSSLPSLQLFLDATNTQSYPGSGSTWFDISGNGRNFTWQNTGVSFNSSGIKYFNTKNYMALGPNADSFKITDTSGYTIMIGMYQNVAQSTGSFTFPGSADTSGRDVRWKRGIFAHSTWGDSNTYFDQGGCCDSNQRTFTATPELTGSWNVLTLTSNAINERSIWVNDTKKITNTVTPAPLGLSSHPVSMPSLEYTLSSANGPGSTGDNFGAWDARVAFFLVYNKMLPDAELIATYNSLKSKIGR